MYNKHVRLVVWPLKTPRLSQINHKFCPPTHQVSQGPGTVASSWRGFDRRNLLRHPNQPTWRAPRRWFLSLLCRRTLVLGEGPGLGASAKSSGSGGEMLKTWRCSSCWFVRKSKSILWFTIENHTRTFLESSLALPEIKIFNNIQHNIKSHFKFLPCSIQESKRK